ncbi:LOW QUALITY PROTEIN: Integral membrane protein [Colletotrichum higginsianum IMI 349063]|uniref:Integral membrane protein n=1 Tax=Colletotrichum higginsianum (strain IMI 349063) TaxID=759273 RepID=A0A1B7YR59_COLHI|nr:LOW QUALITY PROTEIN: Integral membrane protein [Colletotrichum higginsianum IMI 349063]OBR14527.1 LOW QUALITY PROTEIN: Integral membrane protein [Colletotrichum higginsianum IMI 349063]
MSSPPVGSEAWKAQDKGPSILIVCWMATAISTVFVLSRIYVRGRIMGKFQSDDYFVLLGQVCGCIATALSTLAVKAGNGKHMTLLSTEQQQGAILWTTAAFCPGIMSFGLPKLAVVSLLTRLMNPGRLHKWFLWWLGIWCQLTLWVTAGLLLGRCTPARSLWDFSIKGTCISTDILIWFSVYAAVAQRFPSGRSPGTDGVYAAFSAFVDVYLAVCPTVVLFHLQMPLKKKIALSCALGIGGVSCVVAIYKATRIPSLGSEDFSYDTSDLVIWTIVEGSTIIIASSIPVMQPLLEPILKHSPFSSTKGSKEPPSYGYRSSNSNSRGGDIELGQRKPKKKPRDELGLTIIEGDSQENILTPSKQTWTLAPRLMHGGLSHAEPAQPADCRIVRTDEVTVSYEIQRQGQENTASRRWMPV